VKHGLPFNSATQARLVLDSIRRIVRALRVSAGDGDRRGGVSAAQLFVLGKIAEAEKPLSVNELAQRTLTHQSSVSVVVQKLEQQGLVSRAKNTRDARRVELSLTARARQLLRKAPPTPQDRIIRAVAAMPAGRRRQLADLLGQLASSVAGESPAAMFFEDDQRGRRRGRA
jgi:DNA-binding MarR family transcriptional regulator